MNNLTAHGAGAQEAAGAHWAASAGAQQQGSAAPEIV